MIFNSLTFIIFFAVVHVVYALPLSWQLKKRHLWLSSYIFYAAWNPPFVVLLWISTLVDWFAGRAMARTEIRKKKRLFLALSLATNLGLLGYFKYGTFLLETFTALLNMAGIPFHPAAPSIILPVGISFYTFQSLSYSIDIYRNKLQPWDNFSDFAFFVTFFPQLVAGPIVRAVDFLPQCLTPRRATRAQFGWGMTLLILGLFQKVILADGVMAPVSEIVFSRSDQAGTLDSWFGMLAFTTQIFFDFSGYSLCAIGIGMTFGFALPDNFRFPFAAIGFSDFWRRWHISLSGWLRDYLYISLGGNRKGSLGTSCNLMATMLLGGLWHGASWTFVIWGGLHGFYLFAERILIHLCTPLPFMQSRAVKIVLGVLTFLLFAISMLFFRSASFEQAFSLFNLLFTYKAATLVAPGEMTRVLIVTILLLLGQALLRNSSLEHCAVKLPPVLRVFLISLATVALLLNSGGDRAFIYFQF